MMLALFRVLLVWAIFEHRLLSVCGQNITGYFAVHYNGSLWADDKKIRESSFTKGEQAAVWFTIFDNTSDIVIMAENHNEKGGVLASFDNGIVTGASWQCKSIPHWSTREWDIKKCYDHAGSWKQAKSYGKNNGSSNLHWRGGNKTVANIPKDAHWIWTENKKRHVCCRKSFAKYVYKTFNKEIGFENVESECNAANGSLASFTSQAELTKIERELEYGKTYWIGLTYNETSGSLEFTDGRNTSFVKNRYWSSFHVTYDCFHRYFTLKRLNHGQSCTQCGSSVYTDSCYDTTGHYSFCLCSYTSCDEGHNRYVCRVSNTLPSSSVSTQTSSVSSYSPKSPSVSPSVYSSSSSVTPPLPSSSLSKRSSGTSPDDAFTSSSHVQLTSCSSVPIQATPTTTTRSVTSSSSRVSNQEVFTNKIENIDITSPGALQDLTNMTSKRIFEISKSGNNDEGLLDSLATVSILEDRIMYYAQYHLNNSNGTNTSIIRKTTQDFVILLAKMSPTVRMLDDGLTFPTQDETAEFSANNNSARKKSINYIAIPAEIIPVDSVFVGILHLKFDNTIGYHSHFGSESLNTKLMSAGFRPKPKGILQRNITFLLSHTNDTILGSRCVFVDLANKVTRFSSEGCSIVSTSNSSTKCTCNHMTSFAVLTKIDSEGSRQVSEQHRKALSIITYVGLSLSLLGETLTVICYVAIIGHKTDQAHLHTNLALSLGLAHISFLIGMNITASKAACVLVASLIHYFYLVTFCWMVVEGYHLYLMVVKVFHEESNLKKYYIFSWSTPLVIVVVCIIVAALSSEGVYGYTSNDFCWVSTDNGYIWTFLSPVLLVCLINLVFLVLVVREMARMNNTKDGPSLQTRKSVKACLLLFPILGTTWVLCVITIITPSLVLEYFFNIFNSIQGFLIFFLHVVRSTELWSGFERRKVRWLNSLELSNNVTAWNKTMKTPTTHKTSQTASASSIKPIVGNWVTAENGGKESPDLFCQHGYSSNQVSPDQLQ